MSTNKYQVPIGTPPGDKYQLVHHPIGGVLGTTGTTEPARLAFAAIAYQLTAAPLVSSFAPAFLMRRPAGSVADLPSRRSTWLQRRTA